MIDESREQVDAEPSSAPAPRRPHQLGRQRRAARTAEPLADEITIDDFMKVDLRVARVVAADDVPEARKLLKLTLSLGGDEPRTVFAGIKAAYEPEELRRPPGRLVANLAPRKMKFGTQRRHGHRLRPGGKEIYLLSPDSGAVPGQRVH